MSARSFIDETLKAGFALVESRKELRFLISGGVSEFFDFFSFIALLRITGWLYFSNSVSFAIGVLCGFFFHKFWSFRGDQKLTGSQQFLSYGVVGGINFVMINAIVGWLTNDMDVPAEVSKLIGIAAGAILSYILSNYVIFRHKKTATNTSNKATPDVSSAE